MRIYPYLDTRFTKRNGLFTIKIVIDSLVDGKQKQKHINTQIEIEKKYWKDGNLLRSCPDYHFINSFLTNKLAELRTQHIVSLASGKTLFEAIDNKKPSTFEAFVLDRVKYYESIGKKQYGNRLLSVFKENNGMQAEEYHSWLIKKGNGPNMIFKKFKYLRQLYDKFDPSGKNPFKITIKQVPVNRVKLSKEVMHRMEEIKLDGTLDFTRDLFLFSYYCKGMRFQNCIDVKKEDIRDGRIYFPKISKSNKPISVKIHPKLQDLINKYKSDDENLFRLLSNNEVNVNLKGIALMLGIKEKLSFHIARHSLSMNLKRSGISTDVISDVLGHGDTKTTQDYLNALDDELLDPALDNFY